MASQQGTKTPSNSPDSPGAVATACVPCSVQRSSSSGSQHIPIEAAASPTVSPETLGIVNCVFGCGPPRPISLMTNTATPISPRWMCQPCNGARKAIEHQAKNNPDLKKALNDMKKNDPELWRAKVRSCRIRDDNDPPGTTGVLNMDTRRSSINQLTITLIQKVRVQDIANRELMNKKQFMAFLRYREGEDGLDTKEAQDREWAKVLSKPDTKVFDGQGETAIILVNTGRVIQGIRERSFEANLSRGSSLESQKEAEEAMAKIASTGAGSAALSSSVFGSAGAFFHPSAAHSHSSNSGAGPSAVTGGEDPQPLPANLIVPPQDFAPFDSAKRELHPVVSDPSEPASKKTRAVQRKTNATFATGDLKDNQEAALKRHKELRVKFFAAKVNPAKILDTLKRVHPTRVSNEMTELANEYKDTLNQLDSTAKEINNWTASSMKEGITDLDSVAETLQEQSAKLMAGIQNIKEDIHGANQEKQKACRAQIAIRERVIRPYLSMNTPGVLVKWLFSKGGIRTNPDGSAHEPSDWKVKMVTDIPEDCFNHTNHAAWSPAASETEVGGCLRKVIPAYGQRLADQEARLTKLLADQQRLAGGCRSGLIRCAPKGGVRDNVEAMTWVPKTWMEQAMSPDGLRSFGSPWMVAGVPGSSRFGPSVSVSPGMGQFWSSSKGHCF